MGIKERDGVDGKKVKTFKLKTVDGKTVNGIVRTQVISCSHIISDENRAYRRLDETYPRSIAIHSAGEYVKDQSHTNNIESVWALFRRGVYGIYHSHE